MRVGFDAHVLGQRQTGNETYVLGLLHGLAQIGFPVHAYSFEALPNDSHVHHRIRPRFRPARIGFAVPLAARRDRLDLYHGTWILPPFMPCASVVTVHDLTFLLHPEWFPRQRSFLMRHAVRNATRKAAHIIAISQRTKEDIVERYGVDPDRITVTHLAPRPSFDEPLPRRENTPYFLYVGNIQPRKNVHLLVRALSMIRDRGIEIPLILAGRGEAAELGAVHALARQLGVEHLLRSTGYVDDIELRWLYAGCTALIHPALYEGFGLTPLEAMAMGRPVIAATSGSLPEIAGDGAMLVPPSEVEAWADAMERVVCDDAFRYELATRGLRRAEQFSWERCARETVAVYEDAI